MKLTVLERAVITMILEKESPGIDSLRQQCEKVEVTHRDLSGAGCFVHLEVPEAVPSAEVPSKQWIGNVVAEVEGLEGGIGFVLLVEDGRLSMLEGYTFGEPWPDEVRTRRLKKSKASTIEGEVFETIHRTDT